MVIRSVCPLLTYVERRRKLRYMRVTLVFWFGSFYWIFNWSKCIKTDHLMKLLKSREIRWSRPKDGCSSCCCFIYNKAHVKVEDVLWQIRASGEYERRPGHLGLNEPRCRRSLKASDFGANLSVYTIFFSFVRSFTEKRNERRSGRSSAINNP